ncbi:MAG: winged helix-turn-helix domain-containing protein [Terriglobia bacterium]
MPLIRNGNSDAQPSPEARCWLFGEWEFHELSRELRHRGTVVELESKPLDVLLQLLLHAGEVLTKTELLESVWPDTSVVEGSLTTAISKLRRVFGDENDIILTVPRVGYRLAVAVRLKVSPATTRVGPGFRAGDQVPRREQWRFVRCLDDSGPGEVWLAENPRTREIRVFKFASDGARLRGLKREVTVARFLRDALGERPWFVRVLEWNFDAEPWFLESEYAGDNLADWAASRGLHSVPLAERLRIVAEIAEAVAEAHGLGVLHKDLKPANILITSIGPGSESGPRIRIADFGNSSLTEPTLLRQLGITNIGFTIDRNAASDPLTGTFMYLAPEVLAGHAPTVAADVYALGVILYQMLVGDFRAPLSPGWEAAIDDPLLRQDVADAACGDPARRLSSAAELAGRLRNLDTRKVRQDELAVAEQRASIAERRLADGRARRPWILAAALTLIAGTVISLLLYIRAATDRDRAQHQTAMATSISRFLSEDLLGRTDPFRSGREDESFHDVVSRASSQIDLRFSGDPLTAARLHQTIARALDARTDYAGARHEYDRAAILFRSDSAAEADLMGVELQRAAMEARSYEKGSLLLAKAILARQESALPRLKTRNRELDVWLASARGMIALIDNDAHLAAANFQEAVAAARQLPSFDETARLTLQQRLAFAYIRLGDGKKAESQARDLIAAFSRSGGPDSPHVLRVRLTLAQALMIQGKHGAAIAEADAIYPEFVKRLGADHELSMQLLTTRAQSEGSLERWDAAVLDDLTIHDAAVKKQGPLSFFAIATLSDAALAQCRGGHDPAGLLNARRSFEDARRAFGPRAGLTGGTAYALAECLIGAGQTPDAERLLSDIDVPVVAQLAGISDWGANVDLARARIAYKKGDFRAARELLQKASPAFLHEGAEAYQKRTVDTLTVALRQP